MMSYCVLVRERGYDLTHEKWRMCVRGHRVYFSMGHVPYSAKNTESEDCVVTLPNLRKKVINKLVSLSSEVIKRFQLFVYEVIT